MESTNEAALLRWTRAEVERLSDTLAAAHALARLHCGDGAFTDPFQRAVRALYSPQWEATVAALRLGDRAAVEPALVFLEVDPQCFRAGYEKERLCALLARAELTPRQRTRLLAIAGRALADPHRPRRERTRWKRLQLRLGPIG